MGMDMNKLLGQMQQMQEEMAKAQEELATQVVEATAGGGVVTVKANGAMEITEITIDPKAIDPEDPELLADMVQAAVNEAARRAGRRSTRRARPPGSVVRRGQAK